MAVRPPLPSGRIRRSRGAALLFFLACAPLADALPGQSREDYTWDRVAGLQVRLRVHRKLKRIPLPIDVDAQSALRARYQGEPLSGRLGTYEWSLRIYEFPAPEPGGTLAPQLASYLRPPTEESNRREILIEDRPQRQRPPTLDLRWWEIRESRRARVSGREVDISTYRFVAVYDLADRQLALILSMPLLQSGGEPDRQHRSWAKTMLTSLQECGEDGTEDPGEESEAEDPAWTEALRRAREEIDGLQDWDLLTEGPFVVLYSWPRESKRIPSRKFAREMAQQLVAIRPTYESYLPPHAAPTVSRPPTLRVCARIEDFRRYSRTGPETIGLFDPRSRELVVYQDFDNRSGGNDKVLATVLHEGWHQYAHDYFGGAGLHRWFDEGLGDFFGGFRPAGNEWRYVPPEGRADSIRRQIQDESWIPTREIVTWSSRRYYGERAADHYAQGWSLVDFLLRGSRRAGRSWNPEWERILPTYAATVLETGDRQLAATQAFAGVSWEEFEAAWTRYVKRRIKKPGR